MEEISVIQSDFFVHVGFVDILQGFPDHKTPGNVCYCPIRPVCSNQRRHLDLFPSLIEPDERDADGEPLLPRVGHGLAHRHHHLARLSPVSLPILLKEPAKGILLIGQVCKW